MKIVEPSFTLEYAPSREWVLEHLERCGRTCYRSEGRIKPGSAVRLVRKIMGMHHESVIEHAYLTVRFTVDRGVSHELVRHRLAAFSQESTRYVKYDGDMEVIQPTDIDGIDLEVWFEAMQDAERAYARLIRNGVAPQIARSVLPNALRTEIVVTANVREWRHILRMRCDKAAHPSMRQVMLPLRAQLVEMYPELFEDLLEPPA